MALERDFQKKVQRDFKQLQLCYATKIQQIGLRGDPDFIVCLNGWPIYMELKRNQKEKPTALQIYKLTRARAAGAIAIVVSPETWDDALALFERLSQMSPFDKDHIGVPECLTLPLMR